jgi:hypothetical protein
MSVPANPTTPAVSETGRGTCSASCWAVEAEDATPPPCAVPANAVVLADAKVSRAEYPDRGGRPAFRCAAGSIARRGAADTSRRKAQGSLG